MLQTRICLGFFSKKYCKSKRSNVRLKQITLQEYFAKSREFLVSPNFDAGCQMVRIFQFIFKSNAIGNYEGTREYVLMCSMKNDSIRVGLVNNIKVVCEHNIII